MPSAMTRSNTTPTTIPAMAPPGRPLLGLGTGAAVTVAAGGVVLVVVGLSVDVLPSDDERGGPIGSMEAKAELATAEAATLELKYAPSERRAP